jgi:predicted ATPase
MELAYANLHQLCGPLLHRLESLPGPQRQALEIVFGLSAGAAPDRFLVALAVLSLLSEVSEERPVLCVVDDAQWLDQTSALTLAFVARRLLAEPVGLVFAAREPGDQLRHLPDLKVGGLRDGDARALLRSAVRFRLDEQVRDRIVAETQGNPLALLELPRGLSATELAGFGTAAVSALPIIRGDAGAGKTALLKYLAERSFGSGCRVVRMAGVQSETELAFAGLHQLYAPMLSRAERLPVLQRDALQYALGLAAGPSPDGFLVGVAAASLLAVVARERPLICVIDDEQWLDRASVQTLGFAARRLAADPVGLVFAAREPGAELAGLPELHVGGLRNEDARALLASALAGPLDARVRGF